MYLLRLQLLAFLVLTASASAEEPAPQNRHPAGHELEGLPVAVDRESAYSSDPQALPNRLHRLLFIDEVVPEEIAASLPAERRQEGTADAEFFRKGWYFRKRKGEAADSHLFGGDVRISPVLRPDEARTRALLAVLEECATREQVEACTDLREPMARLLLQWDLLTLWWRWERLEQIDPQLLTALCRSADALALPRSTLDALDSGAASLGKLAGENPARDRCQPFVPTGWIDAAGRFAWPELNRKSTKLFHAENQFRASRVFVDLPEPQLAPILAGGKVDAAAAQQPVTSALVLTLMAVSRDGEVVATPVIDEVRIRRSAAGEDAPSSSRDGSSHWIFFRIRRGEEAESPTGLFRFVPDTAQSLFLEYGSAKHTTYFAQCALCHRLKDAGGQTPWAIRSLAAHAAPRLVATPDERLRQAEGELAEFQARFRARRADEAK